MQLERQKLLSKGWDAWLDDVETYITAAKDHIEIMVKVVKGIRYTRSSWQTIGQDIVERISTLEDPHAIPDIKLGNIVWYIGWFLKDAISKFERASDKGGVNSKLRKEILDLNDEIDDFYAQAKERILTLRKRPYCKKCKKMVDIKNLQEVTIGYRRRKGQGICSKCGTAVYKIYSV
jgi:RNase P subunit RPR2